MSSTPEAYEEFLKRIQPSGVTLTSASSHIDRVAFAAAPTLLVNLNEIRFQRGAIAAEGAEGGFEVEGRLGITVRDQGKDSAAEALGLKCTFVVLFRIEGGAFPLEYADRFATSEARLIIWPYFREFVWSQSVRMGIQPLMLPLAFRTDGQDQAEKADAASAAQKA